MGQGKPTALLSANINILSSFRPLSAPSPPAGNMLNRKVRCGKQKVELLIYPDPSNTKNVYP